MKDINFLFAIKPKIQQSYLFYIEKFQSEGGINMAVAIKRVIQFSYAKMNRNKPESVQRINTRMIIYVKNLRNSIYILLTIQKDLLIISISKNIVKEELVVRKKLML